MVFDWISSVGLMLTAVLAACVGLLSLASLRQAPDGPPDSLFAGFAPGMAVTGTHFLFDGDTLVDATPAARALLTDSPVRGGAWLRLVARLGPRFPDLETRVLLLGESGQFMLAATGDGAPLLLKGEMAGGLTRLTLIDPEGDANRTGTDSATLLSLQDEVQSLRLIVSNAPVLIWRERRDGEVIWANSAYLLRATDRLLTGQELSWPLPRMFDRTASTQGAAGQRQRLDMPDGLLWYDLMGVADGDGRMVFALPADATVTAESSLREFMQTLTKTFAHLPIGLAIFDRNRQLQLFNPALLDLTALQPDFLSARPTLMSVLDAMRERSMIPEPKDYRTWRKQMMDLEQAASSGLYEDTWSLPGGQTYRVIGRPHPNGALALMFEDISTEMSRTRRYRADLELSQSVFDALEEGIAVFSQSGNLVMTNAAYCRLWQHNPAELLSDAGIRSLNRWWRDNSAPSLMWDDAESYVYTLGDRDPWDGEVRLSDGRLIGCRFAGLAGGATLVSFRPALAETTQLGLAPGPDRMTA
ncbi:MAG: PAS-domain containing protein [Pseudomonadota bacterium]